MLGKATNTSQSANQKFIIKFYIHESEEILSNKVLSVKVRFRITRYTSRSNDFDHICID